MRALLIFAFFACFAFSFWLMWHTLGYDSKTNSILVGGKYWSDFGGHLPQIRSFSLGKNWPPEYPLYPGEPIRYHFLFYALVGLLEKIGLRIDFALNLPSAIGFFFLILVIFITSKRVFKSTLTAILSVLFFLLNGSLSWIDYLKSNNFDVFLSLNKLSHLSTFPAFAPWNNSSISAFWNLNIYTNQRHLGLSFAIVLCLIYIFYASKQRLVYVTGFFLGLLLVLNQAAFAIALLFVGWFFIFRPTLRIPSFISLVGSIPWIVFSFLTTHTSPQITYHLGFLQNEIITPESFLIYWFKNFGLHLILIPLGFFLAPRKSKILFPPLLLIFIISNTFNFSVDIINNHKFFNFVLILGGMYSAYAMSKFKLLLLLVPLVILGGLVDFFPIKNDSKYSLIDQPMNRDVNYFIQNTSPDSVVLNSTWFYHPASLAGRKIFNGYSYFTWSFGYDQIKREQQTMAIYSAPDKPTACSLLQAANISFVELNQTPEKFVSPNLSLWHNEFTPEYTNSKSGISVYTVQDNCSSL